MRQLAFLLLCVLASGPQEKKPVDVVVDAPSAFSPGSTAGLRVAVLQSRSITQSDPVEGATVQITLGREKVFSGRTDGRGTAAVSFRVPELAEGQHPLKIEVGSAAGPATFEQQVTLRREQKILLVTDKPIYQPGQTIHVRALALADMTLTAVKDSDLLFEIDDAKGNKVFKRSAKTSRFGVASVDFTLADEVNMGDFKIAAQIGNAKSEKTVTVKKYVLPKFKVELKTEKNWYEPLALVKGHLQADYFFGKPVEGEITVKASTFDVAFREFARVKAKCDANGRAEFEFKLPDYFVGTPLEKGNALLQVEAEVTDKADHTETVSRSLVVSPQPLRINALAESGKLVPGLENLIYVVVTTPDGSPVETNVTCNGKEARTSAAGFATFPITPDAKAFHWNNQGQHVLDLELKAQGATAKLELPVEGTRESVLLRLDKAIYEAGQTAKLEAFSTRKTGTIFIDVVKKGQTVLTTTTELANGRALYPLALDPSLFGALELHAYVIEANGDIVRDTKVCYVQPPQSLRVAVTTGMPEYRPGAPCTIDFRVTDQDNRGRQAALGVIIVDESVYALQDMQPGLEKIYFTLEKELAQPKIEQCVGHSLTEALQNARQDAAKMLLANVEPPVKRWNVNTLTQRHQQYQQKIQRIYWTLYNYLVSEKAQVTVKNEKTGKREFRSDLLEELKTRPRYQKITADDLVDPWGHAVTMQDLARLSSAFTVEHWWKVLSWNQVWQAWQTIGQSAAKGEAAPANLGKDCFGDPLTLEQLAALDPAFSKENLARMEANHRRYALFQTILTMATQQDVLRRDEAGKWSYKPGAVEDVAKAQPSPAAALAAFDPAKGDALLTAENISKHVEDHRRRLLYNEMLHKVQQEGAAGLSKMESPLRDAAGRKFDLAGLQKENPVFRPENLAAIALQSRVQLVYQALRLHGQKNGKKYIDAQTGSYAFPPEVLSEIRTDLKDPWGADLRLELSDKQRARWRWFPRNELVSAGPDGKFGTDDDIREEAVWMAHGYQPGQMGAVQFQGDPAIRQPVFGVDPDTHGEFETLLGVEGAGLRGGRFGGRAGGGMMPLAPGAAAKGAQMEMFAERRLADGKPGADRLEAKNGAPAAQEEFAPAARVREYFPETLFWNPQIITNEDGTFSIPVTMADSITTWRLTASANTGDGLLGSTTHSIRVFQDFFVDIDFPVALTQGDRISVPVAVFNYLKEEQKVELKVERQDWFELREGDTKTVTMKSGEVKAVYFAIRVKGIGSHTLTVHARGTRLSDAVKRSVEVVPDGKMIELVLNDRLQAGVNRVLDIPPNAIDGASKILFKAYPGVFASVMDGLEGMLRMPGG